MPLAHANARKRKLSRNGAAGAERTIEEHEARKRHQEHQDGTDHDEGGVARVERRMLRPLHVHRGDDGFEVSRVSCLSPKFCDFLGRMTRYVPEDIAFPSGKEYRYAQSGTNPKFGFRNRQFESRGALNLDPTQAAFANMQEMPECDTR